MKKQTIKTLVANVLIASSLLTFQACNSDSDQSQSENTMAQNGDSIGVEKWEDAEVAEATFQVERDDAVANLEQQRAKIEQDIDQLQDKMNTKSDKAKETMKRQLDKLRTERQDLDRDIDIAKNATKDAWQEIKTGLKKAGRTLGDSFDEAGDRLKNQ